MQSYRVSPLLAFIEYCFWKKTYRVSSIVKSYRVSPQIKFIEYSFLKLYRVSQGQVLSSTVFVRTYRVSRVH